MSENDYAIFIKDYSKSRYAFIPKEETRVYEGIKGFKMGIKALAKRGFYLGEVLTFAKYNCATKPEIIGCHYYITLYKERDDYELD